MVWRKRSSVWRRWRHRCVSYPLMDTKVNHIHHSHNSRARVFTFVGLSHATLCAFLLQCEELTRRCEHLSAALVDGGRDTQRLREWHAMVSQLEGDLAEARAAPQVSTY